MLLMNIVEIAEREDLSSAEDLSEVGA
jgi:hypothetical protein